MYSRSVIQFFIIYAVHKPSLSKIKIFHKPEEIDQTGGTGRCRLWHLDYISVRIWNVYFFFFSFLCPDFLWHPRRLLSRGYRRITYQVYRGLKKSGQFWGNYSSVFLIEIITIVHYYHCCYYYALLGRVFPLQGVLLLFRVIIIHMLPIPKSCPSVVRIAG